MTNPTDSNVPNPDVSAWVRKLSDMTESEIAQLCLDEKITGKAFNSYSCAIAKLISSKTGVEVFVGQLGVHEFIPKSERVTGQANHFKASHGWNTDHRFADSGPRNFIANFDKGMYPDLIDKSRFYISFE